MAARGVDHPATYSVLIVIAGMLVSMATAIVISIQASNKAIARALDVQHKNEAAQAQLAEQNKEASCTFIRTIAKAYQEDPPSPPSKTYETIASAWADLAKRCE